MPTEVVTGPEAAGWAALLRHERIPFVSYPYEWTFGMLRDAALLQLELLLAALDEDMILKDSSPYNVQWRGAVPVFIDVGSFERLRPGEPWVGYRQFCMLYLYPLLLQAYRGVDFQPWLRGSIDGIPPAQLSALMSFRDSFRRGVLTHVRLHARLERRYGGRSRDVKRELKSAGFGKELIRANVRKLEKLVRRLRWEPETSDWSSYATESPYAEADAARKEAFVREAASTRPGGLVWDLGTNDGRYARVAAETARYVVAVDADRLVADRLYRELAAEESASILPLTLNVADPSPDLGWRGLERRSLAARGGPDLTLCLALLHHLAISANVPLREVVDWLAGLGTSLVAEFVDREDPMVRRLLVGKREETHVDYTRESFERLLGEAYEIARTETLSSGTRTLYLAHPRR